MVYNFNKTCSSHMPVLIEFLEEFKPKKILEFGSGVFSTPLLLKFATFLDTVEIQNKEWFNFIKKKLFAIVNNSENNFRYSFFQNHAEATLFTKQRYRLVFIDCANPRHGIVNSSFHRSKNIIVHDTQLHWTKQIRVPKEFEIFNFTRFPEKYKNHRKDAYADRPWTTLFTSDKKVIDHFKNINEVDLYKKHKFPYGITK
jgi:hypothetical protein